MGTDAIPAADATVTDFAALQSSADFQRLRNRHRRFVFPVLAACLSGYLAYVLLAVYAAELMSAPVFGRVNIAMLLGLAQIAITFAATTWYVRFANQRLDPLAERIRTTLEGAERNDAEEASR